MWLPIPSSVLVAVLWGFSICRSLIEWDGSCFLPNPEWALPSKYGGALQVTGGLDQLPPNPGPEVSLQVAMWEKTAQDNVNVHSCDLLLNTEPKENQWE